MTGSRVRRWIWRFIEPTVIEGLSHDCRTNQEEIFGPVVTIMPFDTEEEVLGYANTSATACRRRSGPRIFPCPSRRRQLESGIVWVNCWLLRDLRTPFGGIKDSGVGREGGFEALRFFTEEKNVCIKLGQISLRKRVTGIKHLGRKTLMKKYYLLALLLFYHVLRPNQAADGIRDGPLSALCEDRYAVGGGPEDGAVYEEAIRSRECWKRS